MTLREDILKNVTGKGEREQRTDEFFKAYLKDKKIFGEDTAALYTAVYESVLGEDYSHLFESVDEAYDVLVEDGFKGDTLNLPNAKDSLQNTLSTYSKTIDSHNFATDSQNLAKAIKDTTVLGKIGNFFKGVKDSVMSGHLFAGLKNGIAWMVSPKGLPWMAGSAAGIGVIVAIIAALKKKGKSKDADKLQAALDAAKAKKK